MLGSWAARCPSVCQWKGRADVIWSVEEHRLYAWRGMLAVVGAAATCDDDSLCPRMALSRGRGGVEQQPLRELRLCATDSVCVTAHRRSSNQHSNSALTLRPDVFNLYCSAVDGWMGKASAGVHGHMGARKRSARTDRAALVIAAQCARPGTLSSSLIPLQDRWTPPPPPPPPPPGQCSLRPEHVRAHSLQPRQC